MPVFDINLADFLLIEWKIKPLRVIRGNQKNDMGILFDKYDKNLEQALKAWDEVRNKNK